MAPSTWPVSPIDRWPTTRSPRTAPSSWMSPSLAMSPATLTFSAISDMAMGFAGRAVSPPSDFVVAGLVGFVNIGPRPQETLRVLRPAIDPDFVVQVRAGRTPGRAHAADALADADLLADADRDHRQVGVAGLEAVAVVDLDGVAVAGAHAGERDDARRGRVDRLHAAAGEVLAGVVGRSAGERVDADAEAGGAVRARRRLGQRQGFGGVLQRLGLAHVGGGVLDAVCKVLVDVQHRGQGAGVLALDQRPAQRAALRHE